MTRASINHQSAQLEQTVPVTTIASKPRDVEAEHRADLPSAQIEDRAIEAGPV
jgi:hypothetical protein